MQSFLQDVRYAIRQLRKSPGFTLTAVITLALGIGATTAIFTLVYQVILRSIPVSHPEQLYKVGRPVDCCVTGGLQNDWSLFSADQYRYFRDQTPDTQGIAAVLAGQLTLSARRPGDDSGAQPLQARFISGNYFSVLGVEPYAGRLLRPDDDREGAPAVAVITWALWQTRFGADPHLVGSTMMLTGQPVTIIGISARNFLGERNQQSPPGLWLALAQEPTFQPDRRLMNFPALYWLDLLVRIPDPKQLPNVQLAIQGELHQWLNANRGIVLQNSKDIYFARQTTELVPANSGINNLREGYENSLTLLSLVAGFVLLIACANLANLMLVRGMGRQQELAVRSALGAPRLRLIRQMLIEAIVLSLFGGAAALLLAYAATRAILATAMPGAEMSPIAASPSLPVLAFAFAVSLFTGVLFGITPAWITSRSNPVEALRGANRSTRDASALPQKILVILQAALSLALLSTAGLLITSLRALEHQDFHFDPEGRLILSIDLQAAGYKYERLASLYQRFDDTLAHLPGVQNMAYATYGPMTGNSWNAGLIFPGVTPNADTQARFTAVSPQFFDAIGTRVVMGRAVNEQDTATSPHVAVINRTFVATYLKGHQPLGARFGPNTASPSEFEIVGVVEDAKYGDPAEPAHPMFFTPMTQTTRFTEQKDTTNEHFKHLATNIIVRYHGDQSAMASSLREALKSIDPEIAVLHVTTYTDQVSNSFNQEQLVVRLTTLFGLLALVLASIGLYGVTAYTVARRTSEIGIRLALGARRGGVLAMIVRGALNRVGIGLAIGIPLSFAAGRLVQHTLYQTSAFQPLVLAAVIVLLLVAALFAAVIPARRAASIEPMQALRTE